MNRFMGMMPSSEVEKEQQFRVGVNQSTVTIQSGKLGWTILYADSSSEYEDVTDTTENNFNKAMEKLKFNYDDINKK